MRPPFPAVRDCLKVAAADAGFGGGGMADEGMAGEDGEPMVEAVPGAPP